MCEKPDQFEIESRLYGLASHGDISDIARRMSAHRSTVSRQFNPDDPIEHPIYGACLHLYGALRKPDIFHAEQSILLDYMAALNGRAVGEMTKDEALRQIGEIARAQMCGMTDGEAFEFFSLALKALDEARKEAKVGKTVVTEIYRPAEAGERRTA